MDLVSLLILIVVVIGLVWLAVWVIDSTLPEPAKMVAKAVVGIIALIIILAVLANLAGLNVGSLHVGR